MFIEDIRDYCLTKKGVTESFPFDEETLVFKVGDKMFLLISMESQPVTFSVKPTRNGVLNCGNSINRSQALIT